LRLIDVTQEVIGVDVALGEVVLKDHGVGAARLDVVEEPLGDDVTFLKGRVVLIQRPLNPVAVVLDVVVVGVVPALTEVDGRVGERDAGNLHAKLVLHLDDVSALVCVDGKLVVVGEVAGAIDGDGVRRNAAEWFGDFDGQRLAGVVSESASFDVDDLPRHVVGLVGYEKRSRGRARTDGEGARGRLRQNRGDYQHDGRNNGKARRQAWKHRETTSYHKRGIVTPADLTERGLATQAHWPPVGAILRSCNEYCQYCKQGQD
jgi:hypothetical protein